MKFYPNQMKPILALSCQLLLLAFSGNLVLADTPENLAPFFKAGESVAGEVGAVMPPEGIDEYITIVQAAAKADPEWYKEYMEQTKPGVPLPWHDKLGLSQEQYDGYMKLWNQREFKPLHQVVLRLEEVKDGLWMIRVSGVGMPVSLLRYDVETGSFQSPNGELKRIEDVDAEAHTILGAWKGKEWKYEQATDFISTKENFALGTFADGKHCLLIYRLQESTSEYRLADKSLVIRFSPPKQ
ncbi:MAG: hypothetical protein ACSHX0_01595 [Akkermansiaceae bacterium]